MTHQRSVCVVSPVDYYLTAAKAASGLCRPPRLPVCVIMTPEYRTDLMARLFDQAGQFAESFSADVVSMTKSSSAEARTDMMDRIAAAALLTEAAVALACDEQA